MSRTDSDEEGPNIPPFVWTGKEIKKHWMDLLNTAESLLYGNAPIHYGLSESEFYLCNYELMADRLTRAYMKIHRPNRKEIEDAAVKSGRPSHEVVTAYLLGIEQQYHREAARLIRKQVLDKMNEAVAMLLIEVAKQVCQKLNQKKTIESSLGFAFRYSPTEVEKRKIEEAAKRILKREKLRIGVRGRGRPAKLLWTEQQLSDYRRLYKSLAQKWSDASTMYFDLALRREDPQKREKYVKGEFPEFPSDLIERIPSVDCHELALEHAARLSHVPRDLYSSRQLREYLRPTHPKHSRK